MRKLLLGFALPVMLLGASAASAGTVVNVAGYITGCQSSSYCGGEHLTAGQYVGDLINPVQVKFGPGTYTVTNADGLKGADPTFTAWNFNDGSDRNWIWSFMIVDDATKTVVLDSLPDPNAFVGDHDSVASASYDLNYSGTFTLDSARTLDFITEDYYPYDNLGGVALNITGGAPGVPEPASWALMITGFGLTGAALRSRSRRIAAAI